MPVGRPKKPAALKILEGNRSRRPIVDTEPKPEIAAPPCPPFLNEEHRKWWDFWVKELLAMKILTRVDGAALAGLCVSWVRWIDAEAKLANGNMVYTTATGYQVATPWLAISNKAFEQWNKSLTGFGFDPASRTRIIGTAAGAQGKEDPVEAFKRRKEQLKLINGKKERPGKQ